MDFDKEAAEFVLSRQEWFALGRTATTPLPASFRLPVSEAQLILENCEVQRAQINETELSHYPAGAGRYEMQAKMTRQRGLLRDIIKTVEPHLPEVSEGAEAFLDHEN